MNCYVDKEYISCSSETFEDNSSLYNNTEEDETNNISSHSEGILRLAFGLGNFIANDCGSSYD